MDGFCAGWRGYRVTKLVVVSGANGSSGHDGRVRLGARFNPAMLFVKNMVGKRVLAISFTTQSRRTHLREMLTDKTGFVLLILIGVARCVLVVRAIPGRLVFVSPGTTICAL